MSTLKVNNLDTQTGTTISVASGKVLAAPGHVLQCVQYSNYYSSSVTTTSTSYVASGIKKTITPKASGNLIIIQANITMGYATAAGYARIYMNGSAMANRGNYQLGYMNVSHNNYAGFGTQDQHTTTGTSSLEFEVYVRVGSSGTFTYVHSEAHAALTLWEIAQ